MPIQFPLPLRGNPFDRWQWQRGAKCPQQQVVLDFNKLVQQKGSAVPTHRSRQNPAAALSRGLDSSQVFSGSFRAYQRTLASSFIVYAATGQFLLTGNSASLTITVPLTANEIARLRAMTAVDFATWESWQNIHLFVSQHSTE